MHLLWTYSVLTVASLATPPLCLSAIPYRTPTTCGANRFLDSAGLVCRACAQLAVKTQNGLGCECSRGSYVARDNGGLSISCVACPTQQTQRFDQHGCIACSTSYSSASQTCAQCSSGRVSADRSQSGQLFRTRACVQCTTGTEPSADSRSCLPCREGRCRCSQGEQKIHGYCVATTLLLPRNTQLYLVPMQVQAISDSWYFRANIQAAQVLCRGRSSLAFDLLRSNLTSCQLLANLCVLLYYTRDAYDGQVAGVTDACREYLNLAQAALQANGSIDTSWKEWPVAMPWIFYGRNSAKGVLSKTDIATKYAFHKDSLQSSNFTFVLAAYALDGTFLGLQTLSKQLQLCQDRVSKMAAAFQFGTTYENSCDRLLLELAAVQRLTFYDIYLLDGSNLYPVPVLVENFVLSGSYVNQQEDQAQWQLTRRLFLVDTVSGRQSVESASPQVIRVADKVEIEISPRTESAGLIYPPLVRVHYAEIEQKSIVSGATIKVSFAVTYRADQGSLNNGLVVSVGILTVLVFLLACVKIHGWRLRNKKETIDGETIVQFFFSCCGLTANAYFIILFGASFHRLTFYKGQTTPDIYLPVSSQEAIFRNLLIASTALMTLRVLHLIWRHTHIDIFLLDWEQPVMPSITVADEMARVSIWRTYFVANEWNEIQTTRRFNSWLRWGGLLVLLEVAGFKNVCTYNPDSVFKVDDDKYNGPTSHILRFAMAACLYLLIQFVQWLFFIFYTRYVEDKIRQFVDLCSLCNVSVFILTDTAFGYYIHGRSVHGQADTDMWQINQQLQREQEDLCGKRGLLPNSDDQTFEIAVPAKLRVHYDRVMAPLQEQVPTRTDNEGHSRQSSVSERSINAYATMTKFLSAFIGKSLQDLDYNVVEKKLLEQLFDLEFNEPLERGIFYNDESSNSFVNVLVYGHEWTLMVYDILLLTALDWGLSDFIASTFLTVLITKVLIVLRSSAGRQNLARKTLVDKRFLI